MRRSQAAATATQPQQAGTTQTQETAAATDDQQQTPKGQKRNKYFLSLPEEARRGNLEGVQHLIENTKADPNLKQIGCTALHYAAFYNHMHIVKYLVEEAKAELNPHNLSGVTPLQWAVERQHYDVTEYLLEKGAELKIDVENSRNKKGETALHKAVVTGNVALVKLLVEKGKADVNAKTIDEEGSDPVLIYAAQGGQVEVIQFLLDHAESAAAATTATTIATPAPVAPSPIPVVTSKKVIVTPIQQQQQERRNMTASSSTTPTLGRGKVLINAINKKGWTALHKSAANNKLDVVKLLVSKGADANIQDVSGRTPLHWAVFFGHKAVVRFFLGLHREEKIDLELKDGCGYTAKALALVKDQKAIAREIAYVIKGGDIADIDGEEEEEEEEEEAEEEGKEKEKEKGKKKKKKGKSKKSKKKKNKEKEKEKETEEQGKKSTRGRKRKTETTTTTTTITATRKRRKANEEKEKETEKGKEKEKEKEKEVENEKETQNENDNEKEGMEDTETATNEQI